MNLKRSLAFALTMVMLLSMAVPAVFGAEESPLPRIAGSNRIQTAIEISKEGWDKGADAVVLVNGYNYPDALAAVPFAFALEAPILLTEADALNTDTAAEIGRLGASTVYVIGGETVVSKAAFEAVEKLEGVKVVKRIAGKSREETAALVAVALAEVLQEEDQELNEVLDTAVVAYAYGYADALAAASYAAQNNYPIFLTNTGAVDENITKYAKDLGIEKFIVVGGKSVISEEVRIALNAERIAGDDRFGTAIALAEYFGVPHEMYFATGLGYADALTGGVLAAMNGTGIMLVGNNVSDEIAKFMDENEITTVTLLGGTAAVSNAVAALIKKNLVVGIGGITGWTDAETVTIAGKTVEPDEKTGFYEITGIAPGEYKVFFATEGYKTNAVKAVVVRDRLTVLNADVGAKITEVTIQGVVVDATTGAPLKGAVASLEIWDEDEEDWLEDTKDKTIGDTGVFEFKKADGVADDGKYRVTVSYVDAALKKVYHDQVFDLTLNEEKTVYELGIIKMAKVAKMTISGTVKDKDGKVLGLYTGPVATAEYFDTSKGDGFAYGGAYYFKVAHPVIAGSPKMWIYLDGKWQTSQYDWDNRWDVYKNDSDVWHLRFLSETDSLKSYPIMFTYDYAVVNAEFYKVTLTALGETTTATINKDGKFEFKNVTLPTGDYSLGFDLNDGKNAVYNAKIKVTEGENLIHNIALVGGYNINFELRSSTTTNLRTVGDMKVQLFSGKTNIKDMAFTSFTNIAAARVAPGTYTIKVSGSYVIAQEYTVTVGKANVRLAQQITPAGTITVTGVTEGTALNLLDADGEVFATGKVGAGKTSYIFKGLPVGKKYTVEASLKGYVTDEYGINADVDPAEVVVNGTVNIPVTLVKLPIYVKEVSGYVRKPNGTPATGAKVFFYAKDVVDLSKSTSDKVEKYKKNTYLKDSLVNANGKFIVAEADQLEPGTYTVVVRFAGHENFISTLTVEAGEESKVNNFNLVAGGDAKLKVVLNDKDGNPVNYTIADEFGFWGDYSKGTGDDAGYYVGLPAGTYTVTWEETANPAVYYDFSADISLEKSKKVAKKFDLVEIAAVNVKFWVVDDGYNDVKDALIVIGEEEVTTAANGEVGIDLPAGTYTATIYAHGFLVETVKFTVGKDAVVLEQVKLTPAK